MKVFLSNIPANINTVNPDIINSWRTKEGLLKNIEGIIYQGNNWIVAEKSGPYAERDCMIIYSGENQKVKTLSDCNREEHIEVQKLLQKIVGMIQKEYHEDIQNGELELIIGINSSLNPGAGQTQSVYRPHIHITLFKKKSEPGDTIQVIESDISQVTQIMSLNEINKKFLSLFEEKLKKYKKLYEKFTPSIITGDTYHALDVKLKNGPIFGNQNSQIIIPTF